MNGAPLVGRPILDLGSATTVGRIDDVVIDPAARRAVGLRLGKGAGGDWLAWDQIAAIGPDAVTIDAGATVGSYGEDLHRRPLYRGGAVGRRVLSDQGRDIGVLDDVELEDDGTLTTLLVGPARIPAEDLLGVGEYATVVRDPGGA